MSTVLIELTKQYNIMTTIEAGHQGYHQTLAEYQATLTRLATSRQAVSEVRDTTFDLLSNLEAIRKRQLETILEERGLGYCREGYPHHQYGTTDEEKVGIFPLSRLTLYYRDTNGWTGSEYTEHRERTRSLRSRCSIHLPKITTWARISPEYPEEGLEIGCPVVEREGRIFTVINNIDVTELLESPWYPEEIYQNFGLPSLPPQPKY